MTFRDFGFPVMRACFLWNDFRAHCMFTLQSYSQIIGAENRTNHSKQKGASEPQGRKRNLRLL